MATLPFPACARWPVKSSCKERAGRVFCALHSSSGMHASYSSFSDWLGRGGTPDMNSCVFFLSRFACAAVMGAIVSVAPAPFLRSPPLSSHSPPQPLATGGPRSTTYRSMPNLVPPMPLSAFQALTSDAAKAILPSNLKGKNMLSRSADCNSLRARTVPGREGRLGLGCSAVSISTAQRVGALLLTTATSPATGL